MMLVLGLRRHDGSSHAIDSIRVNILEEEPFGSGEPTWFAKDAVKLEDSLKLHHYLTNAIPQVGSSLVVLTGFYIVPLNDDVGPQGFNTSAATTPRLDTGPTWVDPSV